MIDDLSLTEEEIIAKCKLSPKTAKLLRDMSEETYKEIAQEIISLAKPIIEKPFNELIIEMRREYEQKLTLKEEVVTKRVEKQERERIFVELEVHKVVETRIENRVFVRGTPNAVIITKAGYDYIKEQALKEKR